MREEEEVDREKYGLTRSTQGGDCLGREKWKMGSGRV
jgi:hypothetical protein